MKLKSLGVIAMGLAFSMVTAAPVFAQGAWGSPADASVRLRIGLFQPDGNSDYWDEKFTDWTGSADDFEDIILGVDGIWMTTPTMGFQFGSSWYRGQTQQAYREWVDSNGGDITHRTELETWDLTAAWVVRPLMRSAVSPYFGIGGGLLSWRLTESGNFIDFGTADGEIIWASYYDEGTTFLVFAEAGLEISIGPAGGLFVEVRWREAEDSLGGGFADLMQDLDLSGLEISGGMSFRF